jgi:integrase
MTSSSTDELMPVQVHAPSGLVAGDNIGPGEQHELEQEPRLGTDEGVQISGVVGDEPLRVSDITERFRQSTILRLRKETQDTYLIVLRRFAKSANLEAITKRQLASRMGKKLILRYLEGIPVPSRRYQLAALKSLWMKGIDLPWPIDPRTDLGKLPTVGRRRSPPDGTVQAWHEALLHEKDVYLVLEWSLIAYFGWRPSHVCKLKWKHVQYDKNGYPTVIAANGAEERFKTNAPIAASIPREVAEFLVEWKKATPYGLPDHPVLPWRSVTGRYAARAQSPDMLRYQWSRLQRKWSLPPLRPCECRHWVATACRKLGLSKQASALMMGHNSFTSGEMRDRYDNPDENELIEEQHAQMPNGTLGLLGGHVEVTEALPKGAVDLLTDYMAGVIGTMDFATSIERVREQMRTQRAIVSKEVVL